MTYLDSLITETSPLKGKLSEIALVVFDVDGVLTDGRLYYGSKGEELKVFNVKDGVGLKLLPDNNIQVAVVTAKSSEMVSRRMEDLGVENYFKGVKDKLSVVLELCERLSINLEQVCYVGDDMVDLKVMDKVGLSVCPADAYALVQKSTDIVLPVSGGQGIARLVCDLILNAKGLMKSAYKLAATPHFERERN
ncbi:KdsC family phosphatase [Reinekea marinisedimentorum]|uniref:3-deoxy-D-manno-octulosonate 8-phosphate phosphatase KdsC n=1 Tax=Reinekea marinisedimentorum TaxID=230495 RepID=A0A4R3IAW6_9GAMM|nr:HAD-IIIA family hydrolase [Reinekea marinisedimentorum]TCS42580.1 3-deoxy-D-manno-octulosonate 8-phosphate phosphatase (KDO 8-P phosphatase) [Reinekea marinisedimentorum]